MNRDDVLTSTMTFLIANHEYTSLIERAFVHEGRINDAVSPGQIQQIAYARQKAQGLEQQMYITWKENGLGLPGS